MIRNRLPELMDDPALSGHQHARALRALNRVNRLFGMDQRLSDCARTLGRRKRLSVLDLGSGGGGLLNHLSGELSASLLIGLDNSPFSLKQVRRWNGRSIRCVCADARRIPLADNSVDIVVSSLVLHHFDEEDVIRVLREAARISRQGVVIGDLSRSRLALILTWLTTRTISRSRVFHIDGVRSVRAAFRPRELAALVKRAGLDGVQIRKQFPFRFVLVWRKAGAPNDHP
jgi:ubiquinone/menaquinone biosynthesis C-methylase UbiE